MGELFGLPGMLIGVPIFAMIMTILDDFIKARLTKKGEPTALRKYYPAHAFIKPHDEDKESKTLTQRFVGWVASVETEVSGVDYKPSMHHTVGRGFRRFFLAIGRFFQRLFSVKPIPEDQANSVFLNIAENGMPTNRTFWRSFFLSIFTLMLYPLYLIERMAQTTNIACRKDGKRTWGLVPFLLCTVITLGIFPLIWNCKVINRIQNYCKTHGVECTVTKKFYLLWTLPGLLTVVGPLIGAIPGGLIILLTNPSKFILYVILVLLIQQLEGNIISPKILGDQMGVSALCVLISIVVMGTIFEGNPIALILSVPMFAVMVELSKLFIEHRLEKKGLPLDLAEYYRGNATDDEVDFATHYQNRKLKFFYEHSKFKKFLDKQKEKKQLRKLQLAQEKQSAESVSTDVTDEQNTQEADAEQAEASVTNQSNE